MLENVTITRADGSIIHQHWLVNTRCGWALMRAMPCNPWVSASIHKHRYIVGYATNYVIGKA